MAQFISGCVFHTPPPVINTNLNTHTHLLVKYARIHRGGNKLEELKKKLAKKKKTVLTHHNFFSKFLEKSAPLHLESLENKSLVADAPVRACSLRARLGRPSRLFIEANLTRRCFISQLLSVMNSDERISNLPPRHLVGRLRKFGDNRKMREIKGS